MSVSIYYNWFPHVKKRKVRIFVTLIILACQSCTLSFTIPQTKKPFYINHNKFQRHNRDSSFSYTSSETKILATVSLDGDMMLNENEATTSKQPMMKSIINLVKVVIGVGVLSLPGGVSSMGDSPLALFPAIGLMVFMKVLSAYSFVLIGRMCRDCENGATTLSQAWEQQVGHDSSWIIALSTCILTFFFSTAYSIVLGDIFTSLAKSVGMTGVSRQLSILLVTLCAVNPLCGLKSLSALAPFSMAGIGGLLLTLVFMFTRLMSGAYAPTGVFHSTLPSALQPAFNILGMKNILSPSTLVIFSVAASSYCCHFSAPSFYNELKTNTMSRFTILSFTSLAIVMAISVSIMSFGFLTFGGNCGGNILNNYSPLDFGAILCRFLIATGLISGYPFLFKALKESFLDLLRLKGKKLPERLQTKVQPLLLSIITAFACTCNDVGFVVGLNGAIMGSAINYVFPSIMYLKSTTRRITDGTLIMKPKIRLERCLNKVLVGFGIFAGLAGAIVSILDSFFPHLL